MARARRFVVVCAVVVTTACATGQGILRGLHAECLYLERSRVLAAPCTGRHGVAAERFATTFDLGAAFESALRTALLARRPAFLVADADERCARMSVTIEDTHACIEESALDLIAKEIGPSEIDVCIEVNAPVVSAQAIEYAGFAQCARVARAMDDTAGNFARRDAALRIATERAGRELARRIVDGIR